MLHTRTERALTTAAAAAAANVMFGIVVVESLPHDHYLLFCVHHTEVSCIPTAFSLIINTVGALWQKVAKNAKAETSIQDAKPNANTREATQRHKQNKETTKWRRINA